MSIPAVEIEAANGAVRQSETEKTDTPGSFVVKVPALPEGVYTIRAKLTYGGETDTATFSGVEVAYPAAAAAAGGASSSTESFLLFLVSAVVLCLFGILFYFAWQMAGKKQVREETVSV